MYGATHILATDLDGTLVGDNEALQELFKFYQEQTYEVTLVYVTGRHFRSALSLIESEQLPMPDVLITDVGTEIRMGDPLEKDRQWEQKMKENWNPERVTDIAASISGLTAQALPVDCRLSYFTDNSQTVQEFEQQLTKAKVPHKLIFSSGQDVDILPPASGKGQALRYLINKFDVHDANILVAGDSGNDLEMLTLGYPAVIVGNAREELLSADPHPHIFRAGRHCAGGIQEAWTHFYP